MNRNIDDSVKIEYLEWLLTPPSERDPKTKPELAEQLDVSLRTLYNWENSEFFQEKLVEVKTRWGARFYGDILGRLMEVVADGTDRDATAAARVLLGHLVVESSEAKKEQFSSEAAEKIKKYLEDEGFTVVNADR